MKKINLLKIYILRLFYFLFQVLFFRKNNFKKENVKKILLVRLNHIGDLFITLPSVYCIRMFYPDASVTLVTGVWNKGLAVFQKDLFDEIIYYNRDVNCRDKSQKMSFREKSGIIKKLKKAKFDICFDFDGSVGILYLYLIRGVKSFSSVSFLRFHQNMQQLGLRKNKYNYDINGIHESDNVFEAVKITGIDDKRKEYNLQINSETEEKIQSYFEKYGKRKVAGIHPMASIPEKMWNPEAFSKIADYLADNKSVETVFFGAPDDTPYLEEITGRMKNRAEIKTDFNLGEFIYAASKCDFFISMDSLAQHIVQYYSLKSVIIYMTDNSVRWSRESDNITKVIIENPDDISPVIRELDKIL